MPFEKVTHLMFDCYGTLIDWEEGILEVLLPLLRGHGVQASEAEILTAYARWEAEEEHGPYQPYRRVLCNVVTALGTEFGFTPGKEAIECLPASVASWQPFPDTVAALRKLAGHYRLAILSNIDDAMIARTLQHLQAPFEHVITAEQVQSYKPARRNFELALKRLEVRPEAVLHVAQSLYHDHEPARSLGLKTVHVKRPSRCPDTGVAPAARVRPDHVVADLRGLIELLGV